jgi:hypothetical protein
MSVPAGKTAFLLIAMILIGGLLEIESFAQKEEQEINAPNRKVQIRALISRLYQNPWSGAEIIGESPTQWDFGLTEPMTEILEIGAAAQPELLKEINNPQIKDQIIFLLGGVGDEKAVEPIIETMIPASKLNDTPDAEKINRSANLALTNITVADVIWHHGGGIVVEKCRSQARECWAKWWKRNKKSFTVKGITQSRNYSNYPNYGIYRGRK